MNESSLAAKMKKVVRGGKTYWVGDHESLGLVLYGADFQSSGDAQVIDLFIAKEIRIGPFAEEVINLIVPPVAPVDDNHDVFILYEAREEIANMLHRSVINNMSGVKKDSRTYWVGQHQYMGLILYDPGSQLNLGRYQVRLFLKKGGRMECRSLESVKKYMLSRPSVSDREDFVQFYCSLRNRVRFTHCWNCKKDLNSVDFSICSKCGWIRCSCSACGCQYGGVFLES